MNAIYSKSQQYLVGVIGVVFILFFLTGISYASANTYSIDLEKDISSQWLSVTDADQTGLQLSKNFTIEMWVKPESSPTNNVNYGLIAKRHSAGSENRSFSFAYQNWGGVYRVEGSLRATSTTDTMFFDTGELSTDSWTHLAMVRNAEEATLSLYMNGQLISTQFGAVNEQYDDTADFLIGKLQTFASGDPFDGLIDEVRVWSDVRTEQEIQNNMFQALAGNEPNLVAYWTLDDTLTDSTSNGNDLTPHNSPVFSTDVPFGGDVPLEEKIDLLIESVLDYALPKHIERSYLAHLRNIQDFIDDNKMHVAENQLQALADKLQKDFDAGDISEDIFDALNEQIIAIQEDLGDVGSVPLLTQVASPHPSVAETTEWAGEEYANGTADYAGGCGDTIEQCGCVLASMSMLGRYYGIETGVDGTEVNPKNMNDWLEENNGYTSKGSIYWVKALQYLGEGDNGAISSKLSQTAHNETDASTVDAALKKGAPAIAYSIVPGGYRHYYVLENKDGAVYGLNDPFWYNTVTSDQEANAALHTQAYNNTFSGANLFAYSTKPKKIANVIEIRLASPAELLLTDDKGRKLGYDPTTGESFNEIPGGVYEYEESIFSGNSTPIDPAHVEKVLRVEKTDGTPFSLEVIGTEEGEYLLSFLTVGTDGTTATSETSAETDDGITDEYSIQPNNNYYDIKHDGRHNKPHGPHDPGLN